MSRNLCQTNCHWCGCDEVELVGPDHLITKEEAIGYFTEYDGMIVADAECMVCGAKYLAWVDETYRMKHSTSRSRRREIDGVKAFFDLSYRSAFNDEPNAEDEGLKNVRGHLRNLRRLIGTDIGVA